MATPKKESNKSANDSEIADDTGDGKSEKKVTGRRQEDAVVSKGSKRKLNLDRRARPDERRADKDPHYKGPARRYIIDPRANQKNRRDKD